MPTIHLTTWLFVVTALLSGCATTSSPPQPPSIKDASQVPENAEPTFIPVVRYGRYTLVELAPDAAQRDLMLQVIDVALPEDSRATVGDGLRHALRRSGYQLCKTTDVTIRLYSLPLPAAHLYLGPMTLRDALLTLAGPSWDLQIDELARQVCFTRPGDTSEADTAGSVIPTSRPIKPVIPVGDQP
ncbi:PilL N-terminal domain-containing protein [Klebsiella pneumoniae]|uniref:PFGI-1 class ICE element type IV pilus protein PilL2 n=1 Tax=Klebsiella pneumoniae TaxID=573 RepID=UPI001ABD03CB|nr:PilL N-terminal domain-containing protein [Klebsiella pneumoniae]MBO3721258.1 PilL N-terminal domain-containing protein [Klebsiella pneumoniae]HCM5830620.1 PilL N-terminal domain-containing protein [Klebsiella pneumoniae]